MSGRNLKSIIKEESEKDDEKVEDSEDSYSEISEQKTNHIDTEKRILNTRNSKLVHPTDVANPSFSPYKNSNKTVTGKQKSLFFKDTEQNIGKFKEFLFMKFDYYLINF